MKLNRSLCALRRAAAMLLVAATVATAFVAVDSVTGPLLGTRGDVAMAAPPPTTITLTTDKTVFPAGQYPILTATTDLTVSSSGTVITITDQTTGSVIKTCTTGTSCPVAAQWFTGGPHTFIATVGSLISNTVVVNRTPWTLSLTTNFTTLPAGQMVQLTATANQNVGSTNSSYRIYIFDAITGAIIVSCTTGTACGTNITMIRPGFGSASFGRMDYAPSVSAGVPAACAEVDRGVDA